MVATTLLVACPAPPQEAPQILVIVGNLHPDKAAALADNIVFRIAAHKIREHHQEQGAEVDVQTLLGPSDVTTLLRAYIQKKQTFKRVYILGHGGYDGPIFDGRQFGIKKADGNGDGEASIQPDKLRDFAQQMAQITHPDGLIVISACNSGSTSGVNAFRYESFVDGFHQLSKRDVVGIDGLFQVSWTPEILFQLDTKKSGGLLRRITKSGVTAADSDAAPCKRHKVYGPASYDPDDGMIEGPGGRFLCRGEPALAAPEQAIYVANVVEPHPGLKAAEDAMVVGTGHYLPGTRLRLTAVSTGKSAEVIATCCGPDVCVECAAGKPVVDISRQVAAALFGGKVPSWSAGLQLKITLR
jgi:hypothetical protein